MAKKNRLRSRKAASKPKNRKLTGISALVTLITVLVALVIIIHPEIPFLNQFQTAVPKIHTQSILGLNKPATKSATLVTSSPTPKPSPKPHLAPINYGRSVHLPILYYHYIGNNPNPADKARDSLSITPDRFTDEMKYLSENGYHTVTYPELYSALKGQSSLPPKSVMLSFDDGYIDFFINAFPILQQYNIKSVAFIPTGLVDTGFYLKWDQIKQMSATGSVDFEAHSVTHANLVALDQTQLKDQLVQSKQKLESEIGKPVNFMAYPYGASDERVWAETKNAGYLSAAGTWSSPIQSEGQIYDLPRIRMGGAVSLDDFKGKIQ